MMIQINDLAQSLHEAVQFDTAQREVTWKGDAPAGAGPSGIIWTDAHIAPVIDVAEAEAALQPLADVDWVGYLEDALYDLMTAPLNCVHHAVVCYDGTVYAEWYTT